MQNIKPLTILHSNDLHGDFVAETIDDTLIGGVSLLSGYIEKVREEEKNVLYCIAGDMFRGSVIDSEYLGLSTIEIMNMLSPDVVTIGNHETDYGIAHLLFIEKCARFPIINANLFIKTNHARLFDPCKIIEIDGMKILFIGVLTEDVLSSTKNDGLVGTFVNVEEAAIEIGKICNTYHALDIDLTVVLTHIGYEEDKKLAKIIDPSWGVDIIIGGHSHTLMEEALQINDILIVQAGVGTNQVGRFDIQIDTDNNCVHSYTWNTIEINDNNCPKDEEMHRLIHSYKEKTDAKYGRVVTRFQRKLTHPFRYMETNLGNLISDVLKDSLGVDIVLLGSGSIRNKELGPIVTLQTLKECFPYDSSIYMVKISSSRIKKMMKYVFRDALWNGEHTTFYQVSKGLNIMYNRTTHQYERFNLNGEPIEDDTLYTVALQQYHFINSERNFNVPTSELMANGVRTICTSCFDVLDEYLTMHQLLDSKIEDRLVFTD